METRPSEIKYRNKDDERHRKRFKKLDTRIKSELNRLFVERNKLATGEKCYMSLERKTALDTRWKFYKMLQHLSESRKLLNSSASSQRGMSEK